MKYDILWTQDGSPSLKEIECMHHRAGAYSETQYIYGEAIRKALALQIPKYSVLVVGLGLGYIELIAMGEYLKLVESSPNLPFRMVSFESDIFLKESFLAWLTDQIQETHPLFKVYQNIGNFIDQKYNLNSIKQALSKAYNRQEWICEALLKKETIPSEQFHLILFDAFSSKSTPELWSEEFLTTALKRLSASTCVFSTYACTGILKRTLKSCNYEVLIRAGFFGKRDATLAILYP
jgi:hypothetical protein